jgi:hypothetical protein
LLADHQIERLPVIDDGVFEDRQHAGAVAELDDVMALVPEDEGQQPAHLGIAFGEEDPQRSLLLDDSKLGGHGRGYSDVVHGTTSFSGRPRSVHRQCHGRRARGYGRAVDSSRAVAAAPATGRAPARPVPF